MKLSIKKNTLLQLSEDIEVVPIKRTAEIGGASGDCYALSEPCATAGCDGSQMDCGTGDCEPPPSVVDACFPPCHRGDLSAPGEQY